MITGTSHREPEEMPSPLIDKLRVQSEAADRNSIPASLYQTHDAHWSTKFAARPYVEAGADYSEYAPAYRFGIVWYFANPERSFDACEGDLANGWDAARGESSLDWSRAKAAVRDAWYQVSDLAERTSTERAELLAKSPAEATPGDH